MTEDNLFIQLLRKIFSEDDANTVKSILCGKTPQKRKASLNKINLSKNDIKPVKIESLNEEDSNNEAELTDDATAEDNKEQKTNQGSEENPVQPEVNDKPDPNEAKILDLSPLDMFMALYNGYLDQSYTTEDLVDIDSNQEGDSTITSKGGDQYTMPNSLKNILLKSLSNNNAFAKGTEQPNQTSNNNHKGSPREVADVINKLDDLVDRRALSPNEKAEIVNIVNRYKNR